MRRDGDLLGMDFPAWPLEVCDPPDELLRGLGRQPAEVWASEDYLAVYRSEADVRSLSPNFDLLKALKRRGVIATAPGAESDFVSRFFAPFCGIPEDPVTGSAHCALTPYWSKRLGKKKMRALQVSRRGGELLCEDRGERVLIAGRAVKYLEGTITA